MRPQYIHPRLEALRKESYNTKEELDIFLQDTLPQFHGPRMNGALEKMKEDFVKIIQSEGNYLSFTCHFCFIYVAFYCAI